MDRRLATTAGDKRERERDREGGITRPLSSSLEIQMRQADIMASSELREGKGKKTDGQGEKQETSSKD